MVEQASSLSVLLGGATGCSVLEVLQNTPKTPIEVHNILAAALTGVAGAPHSSPILSRSPCLPWEQHRFDPIAL